jgi:hypothetical protein
MIKFVADSKDGKKLVGIGLSRENLNRLVEGKPIYFSGAEVLLPKSEFMIFFGETEAAMEAELKKLMPIRETIRK